MAALAEIYVRVLVTDPTGIAQYREQAPARFGPGAGTTGKRETVSLPGSTFTALSPPAGAKALCIILGQATSLTLKGITGDTGVALTPASNAIGFDAILPLGASPSIGILNGNASGQSVDLLWL